MQVEKVKLEDMYEKAKTEAQPNPDKKNQNPPTSRCDSKNNFAQAERKPAANAWNAQPSVDATRVDMIIVLLLLLGPSTVFDDRASKNKGTVSLSANATKASWPALNTA